MWSAGDDIEPVASQSKDIVWFNEACHPERHFELHSVYEQVDPSLPTSTSNWIPDNYRGPRGMAGS